MSRLLTYSIMQQKRKGVILGFEPYVAPSGFDASTQPVNIYSVFNTYYNTNNNAKYIYSVNDTVSSTLLSGGTSYRYAETVGGVETITDVSSGTVTWTSGSTKRWVIVNHTTTSAMTCTLTLIGAVWLYCGNLVNSIVTGSTSTYYNTIKYIHIDTLDNITQYNSNAHMRCTALTGSVYLSNTPTTLPIQCFQQCTGLNGSVTGGSSITAFSNYCFYGDTGITSVTLPDSLLTIGTQSFYGCTSINGTQVIPNSVTSIRQSSFEGCTGIDGLTLGSSVQTILTKAFYNCTSITGTLTIPSTVTSIAENTFTYCNFTNIVSNSTGFEVSDKVLYDVTVSGQVKANHSARGYSGTMTLRNDTTLIQAYCAASNTNRTGALTIPDSVVNINTYAFDSCSNFSGQLTIGDGVVTIYQRAFYNCSNIESLVLGSDLETISSQAFQGCTDMGGTITLPSGIVTIDLYAFYNTGTFTGTLNLPSTLTSFNTTYQYTQFSGANFSSITSNSSNYPASDNVLYDVKTAGKVIAILNAKAYSGSLTLRADITQTYPETFRNSSRTGILTLPSTLSIVGYFSFATTTWTRVNSYVSVAPIATPSNVIFVTITPPIPLHITSGATGYDDGSWSNNLIFEQPPVADL